MKAIFWMLLCGTFSMHAMQPLSEKEYLQFEQKKIILTAVCTELHALIAEGCTDEKVLERWETVAQELQNVSYVLKKNVPKKSASAHNQRASLVAQLKGKNE